MDTFDHLWEEAEVTRRELIAAGAATGFVAGFALSVQPVQAQSMIVTDTAGIEAAMGEFPTSTGPVPAYRAMPAGGTKRPVVLVVQEIFGVHEHIKDVCRRLAKLGYLPSRPSCTRARATSRSSTDIEEIIAEVVAKVPDAQVMADLDADRRLGARNRARATRRSSAITGFCWGGRIVWLYAAHNPNLKAGVAWYGRLVGEPTTLQPEAPDRRRRGLKAPVLGLYGGADTGIPLETVEQMRAALKAAEQDRRDRRLPRHAARLQRRLSPGPTAIPNVSRETN